MRFVRCLWLALLILIIPASSFAGVFVSVTIAPPVLPVYTQPPCPGDGYIWTPGYWAYGPEGYYWVPGTWVVPPTVGLLWTPGYWGWGEGVYVWHAGYWGPHIGFYGGVNYGFGYFGHGYEGGYWRDRHFYYNRTVNNVHITNVHIYNKTVINNVTVNRVSYNGGHGGIEARATREQERAEREHHFEMTGRQRDHEHSAGRDRGFLASENHGRPAIAATSRPGEFHGPRVMPTRGNEGGFAHPANRPVPRPENSGRRDERPTPRNDNYGRRDERPAPRQEMRGGRGSQPDYNSHREAAPRPGNNQRVTAAPHGNGGPHGGSHGNDGPHGNSAHQEGRSDKGHDQRH
jgi:WXXGXW repeat (2 copies)